MLFTFRKDTDQPRLQYYLLERDITLRWLSKQIEISPSSLSLMMKGDRTFKEIYKISICEALREAREVLFDD
jgi:DNA-binding Xre family transcriptional regulator